MSRSKNDRIVPEGTIVPQPRVVVKRKCRDIVFLIIFIAYWVGMAIVAQSAIASGDPRRLIAPIDYLDEYCGANNSMTNSSLYDLTSKPYLYYIDPVALSPAVCISACPNITVLTVTPSTGICTYSSTPSILNYTSYINTGMCSAYIYKSSPILNRCVPTESIPSIYINQTVSSGNTTISANGILTAGRSYAIQAITDIFTTWPVIATFLAISLALCFIWLLLMQWLAGVFVWLILLLSNIVMIGVSCWLYFYWKAKLNAYNSSGSSNESSNTNTFINGQILSAKNEVTASMVLFYSLLHNCRSSPLDLNCTI
ncbi:hypothetical protein BASA61_006766 [Batrachochytrium salamandrivorans]|nr:hypothetical protein BASA61_006766 [Batrachochytrium salamandrivorans]